MEEKNEYLPFFVYGSLRAGAARYKLIRPFIKSFHPGWLDGFVMYSFGPFPGIVSGPSYRAVVGDILEIVPERWEDCVSSLDRYEKNGFLFQRERLWVRNGLDGMYCWVYVVRTEALALSPDNLIKSNDWMERG